MIKMKKAFIPFSCKTGTPAEKIEPKVPNKEIWKRYAFSKKFLRSIGYSIVYKKRTRLFIFQK